LLVKIDEGDGTITRKYNKGEKTRNGVEKRWKRGGKEDAREQPILEGCCTKLCAKIKICVKNHFVGLFLAQFSARERAHNTVAIFEFQTNFELFA